MFGYVAPHKCELKVRELSMYEAWYCGLCRTIAARFGQAPRLTLDYDCTFLALLLAGITGERSPCESGGCFYKPLRKKRMIKSATPALEYAADVNILLAHAKLEDDWHDEKNVLSLAAAGALRSSASKAARYAPGAAKAIKEGVSQLSEYEKRQERELDRVADAFASLLRSILQGYPPLDDKTRQVTGWLGYHLGRWIYLMDAWDDRKKDQKSGSYNPFLLTNADEQRVSFLLYASLAEIEKAYDLLEVKSNKGLLDNIVYQGCRMQTKRLLGGIKDEPV